MDARILHLKCDYAPKGFIIVIVAVKFIVTIACLKQSFHFRAM